MVHQHTTGENSEPSWASPTGQYPGQSQQWQGQAGPYYDPAQHYYDPNNPTAWQQSPQYAGGPSTKKPLYKQWWFITILVVLALGLAAIALAVATDETSSRDVAEQPGGDTPPVVPQDPGEAADSRMERSEDGQFLLQDGGTQEQALAAAQERIDAGYSHYGPTDLLDVLRYDGYQNEAIEYALNNVTVDWNEQAQGVAQRMGDSEYGGYSAHEVQEFLFRAGFIDDEVQDALDNIAIDFNQQALQALESYRDTFADHSDEELREYLQYAGFQESEINYAFDNID